MRAQTASTLELSTPEHPAWLTPATATASATTSLLPSVLPCLMPVFLCASILSGDPCLHAPGPESGRSSPYHSQLDVRSSTPTSYQAPKHFHIPGRRCPPPSSWHECMLHGGARCLSHLLDATQALRRSLFLGDPFLTSHPHLPATTCL